MLQRLSDCMDKLINIRRKDIEMSSSSSSAIRDLHNESGASISLCAAMLLHIRQGLAALNGVLCD